jgi:hypothetical protein
VTLDPRSEDFATFWQNRRQYRRVASLGGDLLLTAIVGALAGTGTVGAAILYAWMRDGFMQWYISPATRRATGFRFWVRQRPTTPISSATPTVHTF